MLESGEAKSLKEIATREGIDNSLCEPDGQPDHTGTRHRGGHPGRRIAEPRDAV